MKQINWGFVASIIMIGFFIMLAISFMLTAGCVIEEDDDTDGGEITGQTDDSESDNEDAGNGLELNTDSETEPNSAICDCLRGLTDPPAALPDSYCFNIEGNWYDQDNLPMTVALHSTATKCVAKFSGDGAYLIGSFDGITLPLNRESETDHTRYQEISITDDGKLVQSDKPDEGC